MPTDRLPSINDAEEMLMFARSMHHLETIARASNMTINVTCLWSTSTRWKSTTL